MINKAEKGYKLARWGLFLSLVSPVIFIAFFFLHGYLTLPAFPIAIFYVSAIVSVILLALATTELRGVPPIAARKGSVFVAFAWFSIIAQFAFFLTVKL